MFVDKIGYIRILLFIQIIIDGEFLVEAIGGKMPIPHRRDNHIDKSFYKERFFNYDNFQSKKPHSYDQLFNEIVNQNDFIVKSSDDNEKFFYYVSFNGYLMVFDIVDEHCYKYARPGWFKPKEKVLDWESARKVARSVQGLNQGDLTTRDDLTMAIVSLKELLGKSEDVQMTYTLRQLLEKNNLYSILEKRLNIETYQVVFKLEDAIHNANPEDPFYEDLKKSLRDSKEELDKAIIAYKAELVNFQDRIRHHQQLDLLTTSTKIKQQG